MTFEEYQTIIKKTAVFPEDIGLAYCGLGITGEAGEVADKVKKLYRDDKIHEMDAVAKQVCLDIHKQGIAKELGDVLWYITAMANILDLSLEEVAEMNYNKLMKRRETNTLHGSGDNREEL